jgi:tetratricopeptide (TPR) repeat protein
MSDLWMPVLEKLSLSRAEQAAVKRYQQDPQGRGFLPVADILRAHRRIDESLEILTQGVERHPTFTVARVVLARELLSKGLVLQSWHTLDSSPQPLDDNVLAQKLRFRLCLLLSDQGSAKEALSHMQRHQMLDRDTANLGEMFSLSGIDRARERLILDYRATGIELVLPTSDELKQLNAPTQLSEGIEEPELLLAGVDQRSAMDSFQVVPLNEIFNGAEANYSEPTHGGLELDSTTLADLYCKQGHYGKALAIYRRLLGITPNSDFLRRKLKEAATLDRDQRTDDLSVDPSVVDQMEALEIIDIQTKFFDSLLERLNRKSE